jgi:hypothetical protein
MTEPTWAIVRSRTRCEDIVAQGFLNAGYRAYVPRFRVLTWPHGAQRKPAATMRALFSGLVFVQDWRGWPQDRISQVIGPMPSPQPGIPATLSGADIAVLMDRERLGQYDLHAPRPPANGVVIPDALKLNDAVEYDLAGTVIEAVVRDLSPSGRAIIEGLFLGRVTRMTVETSELRAVGG